MATHATRNTLSSPHDVIYRGQRTFGDGTRVPSDVEQFAHDVLWQPARRLGGKPYSGLGERVERARGRLAGYRRSDQRVYEDACERLIDEAQIEIEEIEVSVEDGIVKLEGSVPTRWMKFAAEDAVAEVAGVQDVDNHLNVRPRAFELQR